MYLGDLYGSQFISAGTSDAWGLHLDARKDVPDKPMVLKCLKARTGIAEAGDRYLLERNSEDLIAEHSAIQRAERRHRGPEENRAQGVGQAAADGHQGRGCAVNQAHR